MQCVHCKEEKNPSEFYNDKSKPSGKKPRCKPCELKYIDKAGRAKYEKEYYSHPDRAEKKKDQVRKSMNKHKEAYKEKRREYLKTDKGIAMYRRQTQKRYAMRKAAFVENVDPLELYTEQAGVCYLCGGKFEFKEMELDHVHPIAKGGKHQKSNCKMACAKCNRSKGSKTLEELSYQMV